MLARAHRLTRGADYRVIVRRGRRCASERLVTYTGSLPDAPQTRFGFIVSKQVGGAVVRNTVRRRLKAVCAGLVPAMTPGTQVVIRALPTAATASFDTLAADVARCLTPGSR